MAVESHRCDAKVADSHPVMTTSSLFLRSSLGQDKFPMPMFMFKAGFARATHRFWGDEATREDSVAKPAPKAET